MPNFPEYELPKFDIPSARLPTENPALVDLMKRQRKHASDFRSKIPEYAKSIYSPYQREAMGSLQDTLRDTKRAYNRRGLLGSGMQTGAEYKAKAATAGDLSQKRMDINRALEGQASQLESYPLGTAYSLAGQNPMLGQASLSGLASGLETDISNMQAQQALWTGGGNALGNLISTMLAARRG